MCLMVNLCLEKGLYLNLLPILAGIFVVLLLFENFMPVLHWVLIKSSMTPCSSHPSCFPIPTTSPSPVHVLFNPPSAFDADSTYSGYKSCISYKNNNVHVIFIYVSYITYRYVFPLCHFFSRII